MELPLKLAFVSLVVVVVRTTYTMQPLSGFAQKFYYIFYNTVKWNNFFFIKRTCSVNTQHSLDCFRLILSSFFLQFSLSFFFSCILQTQTNSRTIYKVSSEKGEERKGICRRYIVNIEDGTRCLASCPWTYKQFYYIFLPFTVAAAAKRL